MPDAAAIRRLHASHWLDPALGLAIGVAGVVEMVARGSASVRPVAAVLVLGVLVAVRRSHPVVAACAAGAVFASLAGYDQDPIGVGLCVPPLLAYSCGAHAERWRGLAATVALSAGMQIGAGFADFPNFEIYLATLGPWWVGAAVLRRRVLVTELTERTEQLEAEQDTFTRLAVRRERARIARELHDIVAHHLAVIVVQAGAGRVAASGPPERAVERLAAVRSSAEEALAEMARLVEVIDADRHADDGFGRLQVLLDDARAGGVDVRFTPLADSVDVPDEVEDTAYRVVQEGLTNAIKHASGAEVSVRMTALDGELEVEVRNDGAASASGLAATGAGLGLTGMRERVESLGGSLDAGPAVDGGWRLVARLPLSTRALTPAL